LLLTDSDGVLTDNGVYYSAAGEEMKRFSIRDGMGVERLRKIRRGRCRHHHRRALRRRCSVAPRS
jgi:3-deoxy-D-manno-octulosonate 8-phosphate phosphatase KdsC-like HAD superfamily phosphatase